MKTHIRWMTRRDMPEVLQIEAASSAHPWCEEDFLMHLRDRNTIGKVAETHSAVVGFCVFTMRDRSFEIHNLAVAEKFRLQGIGRKLLSGVASRLGKNKREFVELTVPERNLAAQKWLRACNFKALPKLASNYFEWANGEREDGYVFTLGVQERAPLMCCGES